MVHDRIHARQPTHNLEQWNDGTIVDMTERDGHCVVSVTPADTDDNEQSTETLELTVTLAIRDLFVSRLEIDPDDPNESPVGERVWYREHGGGPNG